MQRATLSGILLAVLLIAPTLPAQTSKTPPLDADAITAIAELLRLEDTRTFDSGILTKSVQSPNSEVRRRALVSVARIAKPEGVALLQQAREQQNPALLATVVFATGQIKDQTSVPWLSELLTAARTPPEAAFEAARALGKIRTAEAGAALAAYLTKAEASKTVNRTVGEALLSYGRLTEPQDVAPIVRWITSPDIEVRWRSAWALFRPRNPAAVPHLLVLSRDKSPEVRFWAVRGLTLKPVSASSTSIETAAARLREAVADSDRRVRTEALRTLGEYPDRASVDIVLKALESPDSWLSVSAAEALARHTEHASISVPKLADAVRQTRSLALRLTALASLAALDPAVAFELMSKVQWDDLQVTRNARRQALTRIATAVKQPDSKLDAAAVNAALEPFNQRAPDGAPRPASLPQRPIEDYRALVERFVAPDIRGARKPRAVLTTNRGEIEVELYPGEAPLGTEHFINLVESGEIVGTEFSRVVPNFVAQQQGIRNASRLRDEVSRLGLTRANVSWASAGLDTGRPGYTFGNTPQPHNEGAFTALGRVVRGMDVVDRFELGDRITAARLLK
jgi:HEAT repeat protein/cyclophilin family peptidyl-prolyl cis-trans isomerase